MGGKKKKNKQIVLILIVTVLMIPALFFIGYFGATRGATIYSMLTTGGYSNSIESKAIEQGKLSLANLEYDKALGAFELAISEGTKDDEVKKLVEIIKDFNESKKLIGVEKMDEAKVILDTIDKTYVNYTIKDDVNKLKEEIANYEKNITDIDQKLEAIDILLSEGKWADSKVKIEEISNSEIIMSESQKEKIDIQLKKTEGELERIKNEANAAQAKATEAKAVEAKASEAKAAEAKKNQGISQSQAHDILKKKSGYDPMIKYVYSPDAGHDNYYAFEEHVYSDYEDEMSCIVSEIRYCVDKKTGQVREEDPLGFRN